MASSSLVVSPSLPILSSSSSKDARGVPSKRRSAVPWLMLPPEDTACRFYRLAEGDVKVVEPVEEQEHDADCLCLGSPFPGWLVYIQRKDCQLFLFNPLSGKSFNLPSIETLPYITDVIRNSHSGLVESFITNYQSSPVTPQDVSECIIKKIVLSSSPTDDDCIALVIYDHLDRLAFCRKPRPGQEDSYCWTDLGGPLNSFDQIVFDSRKKLFFAFNRYRKLEAWDLHSDPIKRFLIQGEYLGDNYWPIPCEDDAELELKSSYCWDDDYLVYDHQCQELFIITRYTAAAIQPDGTLVPLDDDSKDLFPYMTQTFDVFKLNFIDLDHVELQYLQEGNLGNRAFFIGSNPGFALSTTEFPELKPNSIYFTDDHFVRKQKWAGHDLGIYDCKEERLSPCYYPIDLDKIQEILPPPIWFTPDVDSECLA